LLEGEEIAVTVIENLKDAERCSSKLLKNVMQNEEGVIPSPRDADSLKGFPDAGVI